MQDKKKSDNSPNCHCPGASLEPLWGKWTRRRVYICNMNDKKIIQLTADVDKIWDYTRLNLVESFYNKTKSC